MDKMVVGTFTPSVVLDLARSTGRLEAVGLEVEEEAVASSPEQFRSLRDGELDASLTSPDNALAYRFSAQNPIGERLDARIVGAIDRGMGLGLYGRPGLSVAELRGARLGVDVASSGFALALYQLTDSFGIGRHEYELLTLGSTPRRLQALLAGECEATMLNAGNELIAEAAGCVRLAGTTEQLTPYLGTVVGVVGEDRLGLARRLNRALTRTCAEILSGRLHRQATEAARSRLRLDPDLALRYVDRMCSPDDGLVADGVVDRASLETLLTLRTRWLPEVVDGVDVLASALDEGSGLVDRG